MASASSHIGASNNSNNITNIQSLWGQSSHNVIKTRRSYYRFLVYRVFLVWSSPNSYCLDPNCPCSTNSAPDCSIGKSGWLKVVYRRSGFLDLFLLKGVIKSSALWVQLCWNQSDTRMGVISVPGQHRGIYVFKTKIYENVIHLLSPATKSHCRVQCFPYNNWWHQINKTYRGNAAHIKPHVPVYNHCKVLLCRPACCIWTLYTSAKKSLWHFGRRYLLHMSSGWLFSKPWVSYLILFIFFSKRQNWLKHMIS